MNRLLSKLRHRPRPRGADSDEAGRAAVRPGRASTARASYVLTSAETAPCTCPDVCERDHDNE